LHELITAKLHLPNVGPFIHNKMIGYFS
jgi:hypothetical protein